MTRPTLLCITTASLLLLISLVIPACSTGARTKSAPAGPLTEQKALPEDVNVQLRNFAVKYSDLKSPTTQANGANTYGFTAGGYTHNPQTNGTSPYRSNFRQEVQDREEFLIVPTDDLILRAKQIGKSELQQQISSLQTAETPLPTSPSLVAKQNNTLIPIPLTHTAVSANITGYIASVDVTQQYQNPYSQKIEAVYVFPLPENAGVSDFLMTIGNRHIRGIIRERKEAEKIYAQAKAQGYTASMMSEERPNIFTQSVANIEPNKKIDIDIRYFHTLSYNDGWLEWTFPMVVAPRYNPASTTDGVGAVARNNAGASNQKTELQYLAPTERSGHDISLSVHIDAGVAIEDLTSVNHKISRSSDLSLLPNQTLVTLDPADSLPNKDFVLRYKIAGNKIKTAMFVQHNKEGAGGFFTLMLVPPESLKELPRHPVEMVFVIDTSGSMSGRPVEQAKAAINVALDQMKPDDTFQIVQFDSSASQLSPLPLPANETSLKIAREYLATMHGANGTEMLKGIHAALDFPHDDNRSRVVAFLTDGQIGNETEILRALHDKLETSRVFSFGLGSSPNRYLLSSLAALGNGNAAYLADSEKPEPVMDNYFSHIAHPALVNLALNFGPMQVADVFPSHLPELLVGRPILITGRFTGPLPTQITLTGKAGTESLTIPLTLTTTDIAEHPAIANIWARSKIADLEQLAFYNDTDTTAEIRQTALTYNLLSPFTNFIAVDSAQSTGDSPSASIKIPVPVPDGMSYEKTVQTKQIPQKEDKTSHTSSFDHSSFVLRISSFPHPFPPANIAPKIPRSPGGATHAHHRHIRHGRVRKPRPPDQPNR